MMMMMANVSDFHVVHLFAVACIPLQPQISAEVPVSVTGTANTFFNADST